MKKLAAFLIFATFSGDCRDLGTFGETFEIEERDLLETIAQKLKKMEASGELERYKAEAQRRVTDMIYRPQDVKGITHTQRTREYIFDPTIVVTRDLVDHRGRVFAHKGDRFNPLEKVIFSKKLLFIDGDSEEQIQWAHLKISENPFVKIILVKGAPLDLQQRFCQEVFFDQFGVITTKLGIKHVPAMVFQKEGANVLTIIEEIAE